MKEDNRIGQVYKTKESPQRFAFVQTIPVLLGYIFMGIAFGLMLNDIGYNWMWALLISLSVYSGSMQFVLVTLLSGGASVLTTIAMTLFVNGRHIFYGLSFIDKFKKMGARYPYMIFSLTDETYSLLCSLKTPKDMDEKKVSFLIANLDHLYWITGCVLGGVIGELIKFNTTGVDFAMTALFVVIVIDQWRDMKEHRPAIVGLASGVLCLVVLGADKFLIPSLCLASAILVGVRKKWNMH